jgi:hypothetical protein
MGAFSRRYKLVVAATADPALFDLVEDPNEMTNLFSSPAHRETVRQLARELSLYAQTYHEPLLESSSVRADLAWAEEGTGEYRPPKRGNAGRIQ